VSFKNNVGHEFIDEGLSWGQGGSKSYDW